VPEVRFEDLTRKQRRRISIEVMLRTLGWAVFSVALYYVLPLRRPEKYGLLILILGLLVFGLVIVLQVRSIMSSSYPRLKAISALGVGVPLLLVVFAAVYYLIDVDQANSFTQPLDKTAGIYFAITVFATVGFGDIAPVSGVARILVSLQMLLDLVVFGVVAKVVLGAVQVGLQRRTSGLGNGKLADTEKPAAVDDPLDSTQ
jgi:voltage-gated potassium channel